MPSTDRPARVIAFVLKGYPRLSETFIAQEIRGLESVGLDIRIYSLRFPTDPYSHPVHDEIHAPVHYLPEYLHHQPLRVWRAWREQRHRPGYQAARRLWLRDLRRDPTRNRIRRFGQALVLAHELGKDVAHLHAHFLHTPASVTRYAAKITGLPWSCSAHAKDVWTTPDWDIREKIADLNWLVTCTSVGRDHLAKMAKRADRIDLVYHGLDFERFPPLAGKTGPERNGHDPDSPVRLLTVGRAVPKKGYPILLHALAKLPHDINWTLQHIGSGEKFSELKELAERLGLSGRIEWRGAQAQEEVLRAYRQADIFVLTSLVAPDGDRDGLPNVLLEAQSQGVACLSTRISGIPELIEDGKTGCLVPPGNVQATADGLRTLIEDPGLRRRLGAAGAVRVRKVFSFETGIETLARKFDLFPPAEQGESRCASHSTRP